MTKREWDQMMKRNVGPSAQVCGSNTWYRRELQGQPWRSCGLPCDYIKDRAAEIADFRRSVAPGIATLARGTRFRAPQAYRASVGAPLLAARVIR